MRTSGFFAQDDFQSLKERAEDIWGVALSTDVSSTAEAKLMLAIADKSRFWHGDIKQYDEHSLSYIELLKALARISDGHFQPTEISESDDGVRFQVEKYGFRFRPKPGHYLDMDIVTVVNQAVYGSAYFHCSDTLGMPNSCFLATGSVARMLSSEHHFGFVKQESTTGFLSTFWEQGMEEQPWKIVQDQRFTQGPAEGWLREGLNRISEGTCLKIWEHDGSLLWEGTLRSHKRSVRQWLCGKPPRIGPRSVEQQTWESWFRDSPPKRAELRAAPKG